MARAAGDDRDKALWLMLAQSWVKLAEHAVRFGNAQGAAGACGNNSAGSDPD
jgi:hypothetical protein